VPPTAGCEAVAEPVGFAEPTALDGDAATDVVAGDAHPVSRPTTTRPTAARAGIRTMISGTSAGGDRFIAADGRLPVARSDGRQGEGCQVAWRLGQATLRPELALAGAIWGILCAPLGR
jgi:hypothetical protein